MRYFTAWHKERVTEEHLLPKHVREFTEQKHVPFGDAVIETLDTVFAAESCTFTVNDRRAVTNQNRRGIVYSSSTAHCNGA